MATCDLNFIPSKAFDKKRITQPRKVYLFPHKEVWRHRKMHCELLWDWLLGIFRKNQVEKAPLLKISLVVRSSTEEGVRVCSDAVLLDFYSGILQKWFLFWVAVLRFYKTKQFALFRNFRVISMRFAVFLCYSVGCLCTIWLL